MSLTREAILAMHDLAPLELHIPEWKDSIYIKQMTAGERDTFEVEFMKDKVDIRAKLAVMTVCDSEGKNLFTASDINALSAKSGAALTRVFEAAIKHNKISSQDIDELEGKSKSPQ